MILDMPVKYNVHFGKPVMKAIWVYAIWVYDRKNLVELFCHMQCITMLTHMLDYDFACTYDYIHIYGVCIFKYIHVFVYTWLYMCNIWTYAYINSPCIYDLVFHRLAFSLYTASRSWVSTCKHGCNLIATPKVHRANFPHQNLVPFS